MLPLFLGSRPWSLHNSCRSKSKINNELSQGSAGKGKNLGADLPLLNVKWLVLCLSMGHRKHGCECKSSWAVC